MIKRDETKSIPITKLMVWKAYKKVKRNGGSAGVDKVSIQDFDANLSKNLYKIWNRLASGSYFPPPVKEVEIPKKDDKVRKLGIPTVGDRVAQMVIKDYLEPRMEKVFSPYSYGYRPNKSAHGALEQVRANCRKYDWVIDLDIKGFFDNIDHEKLMLAIEKHVCEKWVRMYIKRWLEMPIMAATGEMIHKEGKGTPQGGVISPLLANIFLHYAFDKWLTANWTGISFVRYADDVIIHCESQVQAKTTLEQIKERMLECGLELHPAKTKIVYCRDYRRQESYKQVRFDFLGYSFQPRTTKSHKTGGLFLGYDCAVSIESRKRINEEIKKMNIHRMSSRTIVGVATLLNPKLRGWINYFGKYRGYELSKVFYLLRIRLMKWARYRYKHYRNSIRKAYEWLERVRKQFPKLFYHWELGFSC